MNGCWIFFLHISICILRIVMYPSAEARPVSSQQIKITFLREELKSLN